jgi:hypothetical protein
MPPFSISVVIFRWFQTSSFLFHSPICGELLMLRAWLDVGMADLVIADIPENLPMPNVSDPAHSVHS